MKSGRAGEEQMTEVHDEKLRNEFHLSKLIGGRPR